MKIQDRMLILETEFRNLKKVVWIMVYVILAKIGVDISGVSL